MPVVFTYDFEDTENVDGNDRNRINLAFKRLGWEHIGNSAFRYPKVGSDTEFDSEDWFNHVIPGLMYFRSLVSDRGYTIHRAAIEVQSSAAYSRAGAGATVEKAEDIEMDYDLGVSAQTASHLSETTLQSWIESCAESTGSS